MQVAILPYGEELVAQLERLTTVSIREFVLVMAAIVGNAQKFCMLLFLVALLASLCFHCHFHAAESFTGKYVVNNNK